VRRPVTPVPFAPTTALPGTPEKVAVLMQRARLKQSLWHPQDPTLANADRAGGGRSLPSRLPLLNVG